MHQGGLPVGREAVRLYVTILTPPALRGMWMIQPTDRRAGMNRPSPRREGTRPIPGGNSVTTPSVARVSASCEIEAMVGPASPTTYAPKRGGRDDFARHSDELEMRDGSSRAACESRKGPLAPS